MGARFAVAGPDRAIGERFREIFDYGQTFPDRYLAVDQGRNFAGRREFEDAAATLGHPQRNDDLLERDIEGAEHHPWSQRPGRIELICDDKLQHRRQRVSGLPESPDLRGGNTAFTNTGMPFLSTSFLKVSASLMDILYCEKAATNL